MIMLTIGYNYDATDRRATIKSLLIAFLMAALTNCSVSQKTNSNSELSDKLDLTIREIVFVQEELRSLNQKLNVMQAALTLPGNILPNRDSIADIQTPTMSFNLSGSPYQGENSAGIAIVEFTDYECPFCKQHFATTYNLLKDQYVDAGIIRYYVIDFPLSSHAYALRAAVAALCAGKQNMYWEYHDSLFSKTDPLGNDTFTQIAESLNLDLFQFSECVREPAHQETIDDLALQAREKGISGTPTFLIGKLNGDSQLVDGVVFRGARSFSAFRDLISIFRI